LRADTVYEEWVHLPLKFPCAFAVKGKVVDFSIQNAYVSAIRKAERFLYVENQYFLGSSHAWAEYQGAGKCTHLVPIEIALKIADKIRSGKSFCCYVVLPMWPEGDLLVTSNLPLIIYS